jgi:endonuclease/exonuclease/phosphatase family metal-dependent hydrolase
VKKLTRRIIVFLNLAAAAGLLFSYLAPLVNPSKFFLPAFFGLGYPYLLAVNLIFLCIWVIYLRKEALISLVVILLGWNQLNNLIPLTGRQREVPENTDPNRLFSVMSYNVRGFDRYHWTKDPDTRLGIFNFIREQDPDIICFQEYYTYYYKGRTQDDIAGHLKSYPESAIHYTANTVGRNGYGIATYSKFPILKRSRIPFNSSTNAGMYTDLLVAGDTVRVFNVHLQSIRFRQENYDFIDTMRLSYSSEQIKGFRNIGSQLKAAFERRSEQADMISNYIKDSPHPVIVMGDFNDTPQSYAYRRIHKGLKDAFRKSGRGFGNSYKGELPSFRIDYIFVQDPLLPYRFKRIKTEYSDHFPIITTIYIPDGVNTE